MPLQFRALFFVFVFAFCAKAATAETIYFTSSDGLTTFSADIPSGTPDFVVSGSGLAYYAPIAFFDGVQTSAYLGFYDPTNDGPSGQTPGADFAFNVISTGQTFNFAGVQLYTAPEASPSFAAITTSVTGTPGTALDGTVTITPEPSSLLMLGTGVLAISGLVRRRLLVATRSGVVL